MLRLIHITLFLLLLGAGPALALELVYPQDGTYVTASRYLIVNGGRQPWLDALTIEINGVKSDRIDISAPEYRDLFGDKLVVEPIFDPGENRMVIEGYLGRDKVATHRATVFYQDSPQTRPPNNFTPGAYHLSEREAPCQECHNMFPSPEELKKHSPQEHPCASCHQRMLHQKHVHGPAGVYECDYCHQVDSRPVKYQAKTGDAELCLECHQDMQDEFARSKFVHGPIEAGSCLICHDPHAGPLAAQLRRPVNQLCLECHARVAKTVHVVRTAQGQGHPLDGPNRLLPAGGDLDCVSCHTPHAAATSTYLAFGVTSRMALCSNCHKK